MDEKTKLTVYKIKLLAEQNPEFYQEMQKLFGKTVSASDVNMNSKISSDIEAIRSALEIRANPSITYSFVKDQRVRDQLIIDNLRMENAALCINDDNDLVPDRRYTFCVNAFYQIENILNYFYYTVFPEIDTLLKEIEYFTEDEGEYRFKRNGKEEDVSNITVAHKINAFSNSYLYLPSERFLKWFMIALKNVRNESEHRSYSKKKKKDKQPHLSKFFERNTFNSVSINLISLVNAIEAKLKNPDKKEEKEESEIESKSTQEKKCEVLLRGEKVRLPDKLFAKIQHLDKGAKIILTVIGKKIIDVNEP